MSDFPTDTPAWLERAIASLKESVSSDLSKARSSEESIRAIGAHSLLSKLETMIEVEAADEAAKLREQRELMLGARENQRN